MKHVKSIFLICLILSVSLWSIDTPETFLGFKVGSDGKLAHYNQIQEYFIKLGDQSPRVLTYSMGKTTLKNDMIMAVISAPENIKNMKKYQDISKMLSLGEVNTEEAGKLAKEGKGIVVLTCNLHSTEIAASQMAMELLYNLAFNDDPETGRILENLFVILVPSVNPDGQIMVTEWYQKYKGTKYEGSSLPYLYHWYAGHDNNRDWFKLNLVESQHLTAEMYHKWYPQVVVDEHQMGSSGDRFFIPPFNDPPTPGIHPLVWRSINLIGSQIAFDLEQLGYAGVASRGFFTGSWIGALDDTVWFHNMAGILFEAASVKVATPIYIETEEVRSGESSQNEERIFSPNPWKGGWWRLRDLVNYELAASMSVLNLVASNKDDFLNNSYLMAVENIKLGKSQNPRAYVVPFSQWDPLTAEKFIRVLLKANVQVRRTTQSGQVGDLYLDAGSFVISLAQPYRSFVKNICEEQHYPDLRRRPEDRPVLPYDMAAWTLPIGMGVKIHEVNQKVQLPMELITEETLDKKVSQQSKGEWILLDSRFNDSFKVAFYLLKKGVEVWRSKDGSQGTPGSFIVSAGKLSSHMKHFPNLQYQEVINSSDSKWEKLKDLKVGLYQNWGHNMTEGWTRYVFDEFEVPYKTLHPKDIKKGMEKDYDVLVFVGMSERQLESGKPQKKYEKFYGPVPEPYSGGIGDDGEKVLKTFLASGKTLVFMGRACEYALNKFKLPVEDVMKDNKKVVCPGSYLKIQIKPSEITYGMPETAAVFFRRSSVFRTSLPGSISDDRRTPAVFGSRDLLLSGWLSGEEYLARRSAVVDYSKGKGRIILIGLDVIHRAHSEGTYKIMFNSLLTGAR